MVLAHVRSELKKLSSPQKAKLLEKFLPLRKLYRFVGAENRNKLSPKAIFLKQEVSVDAQDHTAVCDRTVFRIPLASVFEGEDLSLASLNLQYLKL